MFPAVAPVLLLAVPFALFALAMPPRRPVMQIIGVALLVLLLAGTRGTGSLWYFERGWSLLIGSWFVVAVMLMPEAQFVGRALAAVGASAATCAIFMTANRGAFGRLDTDISKRLHDASAAAIESVKQMSAANPGTDMTTWMSSMRRVADMQTLLFPALLALASLAALGAVWFLYRRFAAKEEQPLRPLREFRFSDHLVWMLIVGAVLMLIPSLGAGAQRAGSNIVLFMFMLYALRGLAVFVMIGAAPGPLGMLIGAILFVVLYPLVLAATVLVGLTDTWLDIRKKRPIAPNPGS